MNHCIKVAFFSRDPLWTIWTPFITLWNWPTCPIKISWTPWIWRDMECLNPLPRCNKKTWKWTNYDTQNQEFFFRWATFKTSDPFNSHWTPYIWVLQSLKSPEKFSWIPPNFWVPATPAYLLEYFHICMLCSTDVSHHTGTMYCLKEWQQKTVGEIRWCYKKIGIRIFVTLSWILLL